MPIKLTLYKLNRLYNTYSWSSSSYKIRFGDVDLEKSFIFSHESSFASFEPHPKYAKPAAYYDVAIIKLDDPLQYFTPSILPICLPDENDFESLDRYSGHLVRISGWGKLDINADSGSNVLRSTPLTMFSQEHCNHTHKSVINIPSLRVTNTLPHFFQPSIVCAGDVVSTSL